MRRKMVINFSALMICLLVLFLFPSYSYSLKQDTNESPADTNIANELFPPRALSLDASLDEAVAISFNNTNHFIAITSACGYYQNAYGALPQKLEDLMNGFMLAWPGCPYTDKPVKIINQMSDPQNPDHVGKVYYERIDDLHGNIFFLNIDIKAYQNGQFSWEIEKREIELPYKQFKRDGSGSLEDSTVLAEKPAETRMWFGYRRYISQLLETLTKDSLERDGALENQFSDLFKNSNYYLFKNGIQTLANGILSGNVVFDLGYVDGNLSNYIAYYYVENIDLDTLELQRVRRCTSAELMDVPLYNQRYTVSDLLGCPENDTTFITVFNSKNYNSYTFPEEWIITKDDVI